MSSISDNVFASFDQSCCIEDLTLAATNENPCSKSGLDLLTRRTPFIVSVWSVSDFSLLICGK